MCVHYKLLSLCSPTGQCFIQHWVSLPGTSTFSRKETIDMKIYICISKLFSLFYFFVIVSVFTANIHDASHLDEYDIDVGRVSMYGWGGGAYVRFVFFWFLSVWLNMIGKCIKRYPLPK